MEEDIIQGLLKKAAYHSGIGEYREAGEYFNSVLETDPENAGAWYGKSKLPILQEDTVVYNGCSISISRMQALDPGGKTIYLQQCGVTPSQIVDADNYLQVNRLIESERLKYMEKAVRFADENRAIYEKEFEQLRRQVEERGIKEDRLSVIFGIITLPVILVVMANLIYSFANSGYPSLIASVAFCLIPYILSVVGMSFLSKAKREGKNSTAGSALNIVSLTLSNACLILGVIFLIIK